ncbi:MAG TPA: M36 family metallopeptidase [Kofleriaceae bacterium]|nr:M36 family metallopeptidase [Kofleriaceae bacterium]
MSGFSVVVVPCAALALIATCSPPPPTTTPEAAAANAQSARDLSAVALSVVIDARDEHGVPRLIRAVAPRPAPAGMTPEDAARAYVAALAPLSIERGRVADLVTRGVQKLRNGAAIVRLQQQVQQVDVYQGELRVMVQPDGTLAAVSGTLRPSGGPVAFQSTPVVAVERALDVFYGEARPTPEIREGTERAGYRELIVAEDPALVVHAARARRELLPDGDRLIATWAVELIAERVDDDGAMQPGAHHYLFADADGQLMRDVDLTASDTFNYRVFADTEGNHHPLDGALESFNPHPTGTPDHTVPPPGPYNLVAMEAFNGPHDPWLPPGATTTSGNNVDAFADVNQPLGFTPGDIQPTLTADHAFDRRYDLTAEPLSTQAQSMAAAVNVFFVTNWLHDWYYDSGFTEATGNAQVDNFGRGGEDGDPLAAHAQANANGGSRDNANMTTPDDGLSPTMNMFLWTGLATTSLTTPTGSPPTAQFFTGPRFFDLTGQLVLTVDRTGGTHRACGRVTAAVAGRIALFEFDGTCSSTTAMANLRSAGAIGAVGMIAVPGTTAQVLTGSATANIPGLAVGFDDGLALEAALPVTVAMHRTTTIERDGDFDNAIISHEWGHYLHHRLASCVAKQCSAMSEGWGDFIALHLMLGPSDNRTGSFGTGLYAVGAGGLGISGFTDPGYFGIRRFPYRTNPVKGLSFRHISDGTALPDVPINPGPATSANSEVHNAGEVWAAMLWDAYNAVLDGHAFAEGRRRMSDYVVAGLLLTPPDATFTEARDAILAAAAALDTDDSVRMAEAFAARGAGTCAVSPGSAETTFAGVVESSAVAARLATSAISLTDDGVSCDHDGYLDPGETGMLRITLSNSGFVPAEGVTVRVSTTAPGVLLGRTLALGSVSARTSLDLAIPVQVTRAAPLGTVIDLAVHVEGTAGCNTGALAVVVRAPIGVNEKPDIATTDTVETQLSAWTPTGDVEGPRWSRIQDPVGNHALFGSEVAFLSDTQLVSPVLQASLTEPLVVTLRHAYNFAATQAPGVVFNGGVIEVSSDGGATWRDVTKVGVDPHYPSLISIDFITPLSGRRVFGGKNPSFPERDPLTLDFGTQFAGRAVQLRFRIGTELCCAVSGWQIDDIAVHGLANTPFPGFVVDVARCLGGTTMPDSAVVRVRSLPRYSLDGAPGATGS